MYFHHCFMYFSEIIFEYMYLISRDELNFVLKLYCVTILCLKYIFYKMNGYHIFYFLISYLIKTQHFITKEKVTCGGKRDIEKTWGSYSFFFFQKYNYLIFFFLIIYQRCLNVNFIFVVGVLV